MLGGHGYALLAGSAIVTFTVFVAAAAVAVEGDKVLVFPFGQPYFKLLEQLSKAPKLAKYELSKAAQRAPEAAGGLNIEGLAAHQKAPSNRFSKSDP